VSYLNSYVSCDVFPFLLGGKNIFVKWDVRRIFSRYYVSLLFIFFIFLKEIFFCSSLGVGFFVYFG
jgi:hypothetical protein